MPLNAHRLALLALFICCLSLGPGRLRADPAADRVEIRSADGQVLIAADEIRRYAWATHTLTLAPGVRERVAAGLRKSGRLTSGVPFALSLGGETLYRGVFTTVVSSQSQSVPVILIDPTAEEARSGLSEIRIQLGYPGVNFFKGEDPRANPRLRRALEVNGKLVVNPADHAEWVGRALREMQAVQPGMTRADLLKVFREEGGVSTRRHRRYAYRDCRLFKVDVTFEPVGEADEKRSESSRDRITQISRPFLELPIED